MLPTARERVLPIKNIFGFAIALFFAVNSSAGTMTIHPRAPAPESTVGATSYAIYYAAVNGGDTTVRASSRLFDFHRGFKIIDTTAPSTVSNFITLDVVSTKSFTVPSGEQLGIIVNVESSTVVPISGYSAVGSGDSTTIPSGGCSSCAVFAPYTAGSRVRISLSLADICAVYSDATFCNGGGTPSIAIGGMNTKSLTVAVGPTSGGTMTPGTSGYDSATVSLNLVAEAPTLSGGDTCADTPSSDQYLSDPNFYFPGDTEILIDPSSFGATTGLKAVPVINLLFLGKRGGSNVTTFTAASPETAFAAADIIDYIGISGSQKIPSSGEGGGFENDILYRGNMYAENYAGFISEKCRSSDQTNGIVARQINGVLAKSRCFIATAAYNDADVYPVQLLRKFRDEVLLKFDLGKSFVGFYYRHSPDLAQWAWDKPWARMLALKILTPLEIFAFLILHPLAAILLILGVFSLFFGVRKVLPFFLIFLTINTFAQTEAPAPKSDTPYLDQLKKKIQERDAKNNVQNSTSYSEQEKAKLQSEGTQPESGSYSEKLKNELNGQPTENSGSYSEQEKSKITPEDKTSVIEGVKAGTYQRKKFERPPIENAFGLKLGVDPGIEVVADGGVASYSQVYGAQWVPEIYFHYERQLFHDDNYGSFAPTLDIGFSYVGAYGVFTIPFNGSNRSRTTFSLIQYPFLVGANYRMNLMRIIRPYAAGNAGVYGISEVRNDKRKDKHDASIVYSVSAGVALLLDFLDSKSMRDSYDASGFQHIYLTAEYLYMRTIAGNVAVGRNGIYSGFLYEF